MKGYFFGDVTPCSIVSIFSLEEVAEEETRMKLAGSWFRVWRWRG
jgi:hypothetical protein